MEQGNSKFYGWYIVFINAFIGCLLSAGFPQFSMTVGYLSEKMNVSQELLLSGDTVKTIAVVIAMMASGFCYKKFGAKKTFAFGMSMATIPQFIYPYINSIPLFFALKFIQGLTSVIFPVFLLIIMDWIDEKQTGLSTAVFNGIFYGGGGIGGTFAGYIIASQGWVASYWALAILQAVISVIWLLTVKENSSKKQQVIEGNTTTKSEISVAQLLQMPKVWLLVIGFISTTWAVQAISVDMPLFSSFLGYSEMDTGKVMSAVTIGIVSACLVSGKISDVFAAKKENKSAARVLVLMIGCIIMVCSIMVILLADLSNFTVFYGAVLFFSFGGAWGLGSFYSILPEIFDDKTLPIVTGFAGGCGDAGMPLAPLVVGIVFGVRGLWNIGWGICGVIAAASVVSCMILIKILGGVSRNINMNRVEQK